MMVEGMRSGEEEFIVYRQKVGNEIIKISYGINTFTMSRHNSLSLNNLLLTIPYLCVPFCFICEVLKYVSLER